MTWLPAWVVRNLCILLPDVTEDMAHTVAERLRAAIADKGFKCNVPDGQLSITTSIGGTIVQEGTHASPEDVLKQADDALYAAKDDGRNASFFHEKGRLQPEEHKAEPRMFLEYKKAPFG